MKNLKSLVLTFIGMLALIVCASMFTACSQDDKLQPENLSESFNSNEISIEVMPLDSLSYPMTRSMNSGLSTDPWGSYTPLPSTGTSYGYYNDYFTAGLYAIKIRKSGGGTIYVSAENLTSDDSYTWTYKFDNQNNQLYFSGSMTLPYSMWYDWSYSITGTQYLVLVLHVMKSGQYIFWYR